MNTLMIEVIEWDGQYLSAWAPPLIFSFQPRSNQPIVDLKAVYSEVGQVVSFDDYPLEQMTRVHQEVTQAWQQWEKESGCSLFSQLAQRIYVAAHYSLPADRDQAKEIVRPDAKHPYIQQLLVWIYQQRYPGKT